MNIVPSARVRHVATLMLQDAETMPGADAALAHLRKLRGEELPALIGVLLTNSKLNKRPGRQRLPLTYTPAMRKKANRQYRAGMRDEWTVKGWREYQRAAYQQRAERAAASTGPVEVPFRVSVAQRTISRKDTTKRVDPRITGAGTPTGGLADRKDTTDSCVA